MPGKVLRRYTICKKFHASYLVNDPKLGKSYLCYCCWRASLVTASEQPISLLEEKDEIKREANSPRAAGNLVRHNESR